MATGGKKRKRSERVAALELPPNSWERMWGNLRRPDVLARIALAAAAALLLCLVIRAWDLPYSYRSGYRPPTDLTARVSFQVEDLAETRSLRDRAQWQVPYVFVRDPEPLKRLEETIRNSVLELLAAPSYEAMPRPQLWQDFMPPDPAAKPAETESRQAFDAFRKALSEDEDLKRLMRAIGAALKDYDSVGLLRSLQAKQEVERRLGEGNQDRIVVRQSKADSKGAMVGIDEVIGSAATLRRSLEVHLEEAGLAGVTEPVFRWLWKYLPDTLVLDETATKAAMERAIAAVPPAKIVFEPGAVVVSAGTILTDTELKLLAREHQAANEARTSPVKLGRAVSVFFLFSILLGLCGLYLVSHEQRLFNNLRQLAMVAMLAVLAVGAAVWASADAWRAELIPVLLFGQILTIAYTRQLALLFSGVVALAVVLGLGQSIGALCLLWGVATAAVLQLDRVRSRSKLIYVGVFASVAAFFLTLVVAALESQSLSRELLVQAGRNAVWAVAAGFVMNGLLPYVERLSGVLTDMSLLELGDVSHPLLQELVRRAPSTYNHSVTVGSIAEAAADAIGARGLLTRVGAYFHDIGKMLKPTYYIENQPPNENRHESLVPQMSTLVIVAHIKDGADLARQHRLPEPIIDFIEQHHGTTLVEYFYGRASEQRQNDPDGGAVEESSFRYPGPKPQTKEAAVLMLADAAESACRSLVEPGPARIESLVREIAERKLEDGQFDESGLTFRELRTVEDSMIKSLIANYHGRIKYPEQRTA